MITRTYVVNATNPNQDRDAGLQLIGIPAGSKIVVQVGNRWQTAGDLTHWLAELLPTHHLDLHGSSRAVNNWAESIRDAA